MLDTFSAIKRIEETGLPRRQAEALIRAFVDEILNKKVVMTHRYIKRLEEAGVPSEHARAFLEAVLEIMQEYRSFREDKNEREGRRY